VNSRENAQKPQKQEEENLTQRRKGAKVRIMQVSFGVEEHNPMLLSSVCVLEENRIAREVIDAAHKLHPGKR